MKKLAWKKVLLRTLIALVVFSGVIVIVGMNFDRFGTYGVRRIAKMLHIPVPGHRPLTPAEHAEAMAEAAAWKVKFAAEFPALNVAERSMPPEANGFLQLYQLGSSNALSEDFEQFLNGDVSWDPDVAKRHLTEHADFVGKIEKIAALSTRSSSNMPADYRGNINARCGSYGAKILLLKARLAADADDELETLRLVSAAGNLGAHYHEIEAPSLLSETIVILIDLNIQHTAIATLLPAIGKTADLERWKAVLGRMDYSTTELARVMRGEWNVGAELMAFPLVVVSQRRNEMRDAEAMARAYSEMFNRCVSALPAMSLAEVMNHDLLRPGVTSHLSEESKSLLEGVSSGPKSWLEGYIRAARIHQQHQAALDLLILEKGGAKLADADASRITLDPASGAPFVFDPSSRELSAAVGPTSIEVEPLALPW